MNVKEQVIAQITEFLRSDEKAILITGTHQFEKHKLVMALLNEYYENAKILFRVNGMQNITNNDFAGFAGVKKTPKSGEKIKIGNNYYTFDSLNKATWNRAGNDFDFAILYPIDAVKTNDIDEVFNDLKYKNIGKLFIVSWTDNKMNYYVSIPKYFNRHVIYNAE